MKLLNILKAAVLARVVGIEPVEACVMAERPATPGNVAEEVAKILARGSRYRTSSACTHERAADEDPGKRSSN